MYAFDDRLDKSSTTPHNPLISYNAYDDEYIMSNSLATSYPSYLCDSSTNSTQSTFDDITPSSTLPLPTVTSFCSHDLYDPALCLTPERSLTASGKIGKCTFQRLKGDSNEGRQRKDENLEGSQRVRFDRTVEVRHLSPEADDSLTAGGSSTLSSCSNSHISDNFDISESDDSFRRYYFGASMKDDTSTGPKTYSYEISNNDRIHGCDRTQNDSNSMEQSMEEPLSVIASDLKNFWRQRPNCKTGSKSSKEKRKGGSSGDVFVDSGFESNASLEQSVLARPELNSTLKISRERTELASSSFDVATEVEKKLQLSAKTREEIQEKVSNKLNLHSPQFNGLVSLDVRSDDVKQRAESQMTARAKTAAAAGLKDNRRPEDIIDNPADILEFFTDDLQWEPASLAVEGPCQDKPVTPSLTAHIRAFDVYKHYRVWQCL